MCCCARHFSHLARSGSTLSLVRYSGDMSREERVVTIPEGLESERIDAALARLLGISRSVIVDLIEAGDITRNGKALMKSEKVSTGQLLEIRMPEPKKAVEAIATPVSGLEVVFNDDDVIVINKPAGVASHPSPGWHGPTVVGALMAAGYTITTTGAQERQGVVHRLDVGTTGLMVLAKNENAYTSLKEQFRTRTVEKTYHALIQGHMDPAEGTIDAPIDRHPKDDYRFAVVADGKPSITHYETLEFFPACSLLEIELETGRTHQIRVHFSALHHPLVGDITYGADHTLASKLHLTRPWLHAKKLGFMHPRTGERMKFETDYPTELSSSLESLQGR